jgi:hypothetical protein
VVLEPAVWGTVCSTHMVLMVVFEPSDVATNASLRSQLRRS